MGIRDMHYSSSHLLDLLNSKMVEFSKKASLVEELRGHLREEERKQADLSSEIVDIKGEILKRMGKS